MGRQPGFFDVADRLQQLSAVASSVVVEIR
jgi:hypothetical protein